MRKLLISVALMLAAPLAHAQHEDFPSKPIRIVVPFNAGSGSDETSRVYGEMVSKILGQPVIIENRPGGSGLLAIQAVKSAPADGYSIMLGSNSPMAVNPVVMKDLPYEGDKRVPIFPDVPTMMESGFDDLETYVWAAMYVRSETPDAVVKKLSDAFHEALSSEQGKAYQATRPTSPLLLQADEMSKFHRREYERFKRVAEAAGIQPQ